VSSTLCAAVSQLTGLNFSYLLCVIYRIRQTGKNEKAGHYAKDPASSVSVVCDLLVLLLSKCLQPVGMLTENPGQNDP